MAGSYLYEDEEKTYNYILDVYKTLIIRDINEKYNIKNNELLDNLTNFMMDNISNITSIRNITNSLNKFDNTLNHKTIGSYSWGNYKDSSYPANVEGYGKAQETGHSEYWSANKIYDLAGNYYDLTQEANNNDKRLNRGDGYNGLGLKYSASSRYGYSVNEAIGPLTARVTLIISDSVS